MRTMRDPKSDTRRQALLLLLKGSVDEYLALLLRKTTDRKSSVTVLPQ